MPFFSFKIIIVLANTVMLDCFGIVLETHPFSKNDTAANYEAHKRL